MERHHDRKTWKFTTRHERRFLAHIQDVQGSKFASGGQQPFNANVKDIRNNTNLFFVGGECESEVLETAEGLHLF